MKSSKKDYRNLKYNLIFLIFSFLISNSLFADDISFQIQGNDFTDNDVIISILKEIPDKPNKEYTNDIIRLLNNSDLFSDVQVTLVENKYLIKVKEYPNIDKIFFENNERLKDEELEVLVSQIQFTRSSNLLINLFISELKKIYQSFGYNNIQIDYTEKLNKKNNTSDLYFIINEGQLTKINRIIFNSDNLADDQEIRQIIKSQTKTIRNIFANNNFKPDQVERDKYTIINYYKNSGYIDVDVDIKIEYLKSNKVNIYFNIEEGNLYSLSSIEIDDTKNIINEITLNKINDEIKTFLIEDTKYSTEKIKNFEKKITSIIFESDLDYFEVNSFEKKNDNNVDILIQILPIIPKYTNQINIIGNTRTFDHVIRRELEIVEGDAIYENQLETIKDKLLSLNLFETVNLKQDFIDENNLDLIIEVEEKQTGTFNAGVSVGTLDGFAVVTGLRERNFYGTGRSLEVLINTSEDKNQFKLITTDRLSYENDSDISYSINYKQEDFSLTSSYKLDTFTSGIGIEYKINKNVFHNINLQYSLKDYNITDTSTVSNPILESSGLSMSYLVINNLRYSTLNSRFISKTGNYFNFNNAIETPTSSNNGFVRNIVNYKKYLSGKNSIYSLQGKLGNIFSLSNNDVLTDDKFSLGGRWLRGFDSYGAGPRNSRTSYVGGNNIAVIKLDYSYEITKQNNFPFYLNIFNDYGLIWENKTKPTQSDTNLRSSAGFGIKYYSPIGPIGFTWGFPLMDQEYDIKRMFLFSIGNID